MIIHENRIVLAKALAQEVGDTLSRIVAIEGAATLAVSGGSTPQLFFEHLSKHDIAWSKITVTLVDERAVDEQSPRSNARLVKAHLLQNKAAHARFVPLWQNEAAASALFPDVVVLGMGTDGHTASFFPGADRLAEALDPANSEGVVAVTAVAAGEPRLTFTFARLIAAASLFLHIEGAEKRRVLEQAKAGKDCAVMPVRAVLHSSKPIHIHWCP